MVANVVETELVAMFDIAGGTLVVLKVWSVEVDVRPLLLVETTAKW